MLAPTRPDALRPHDLVWRAPGSPLTTAEPRPDWLDAALGSGGPLVVRRAPRLRGGWIAVGIRGAARAQRCAAWLPTAAVSRVVTPEDLVRRTAWRSHPRRAGIPALHALDAVKAALDDGGWDWGLTGSVGFELASGLPAIGAASDIDLVIRMPRRLARAVAGELLARLHAPHCRLDVQLETPCGAVALAEWARHSGRVLLKTADGPLLVDDPWDTASGR